MTYHYSLTLNIYDKILYFDGRIESIHEIISEFVNNFYEFESDCGIEYYGPSDDPHEFWKETIDVFISEICPNLEIISKFEQKITEIIDKEFKSWNLAKAIIRGGE